MYILLGVIVFVVVFIFVKYWTMEYMNKKHKEYGRNIDIKKAEKKK